MKIGLRKPSLKKSFKAMTTGKAKRKLKKALIPGYGKKGIGLIKNPIINSQIIIFMIIFDSFELFILETEVFFLFFTFLFFNNSFAPIVVLL